MTNSILRKLKDGETGTRFLSSLETVYNQTVSSRNIQVQTDLKNLSDNFDILHQTSIVIRTKLTDLKTDIDQKCTCTNQTICFDSNSICADSKLNLTDVIDSYDRLEGYFR